MKKIAVSLVMMLTMFFISGLFFLNAGIIYINNGNLNEKKAIEILYELDSLPFLDTDVDKIEFRSVGEITLVENTTLYIYDDEIEVTFRYDTNTSGKQVGEKVRVYYSYNPELEAELVRVRWW